MDENKLNNIVSNFLEIEKKLSNLSEKDFSDYAKLSKEYSNLKPLVEKINKYKKDNNGQKCINGLGIYLLTLFAFHNVNPSSPLPSLSPPSVLNISQRGRIVHRPFHQCLFPT